MTQSQWPIFTGKPDREPNNKWTLPDPPSWRTLGKHRSQVKGKTFQIIDETQVKMVNAALYLRRPLLITGKPGTGKSSIAYKVADELQLGEVLYWPITTRTTLKEGLYNYDAIGRLQEVKLQENPQESLTDAQRKEQLQRIEQYITLGPLGTALLESEKSRILLIDEIDKSDIDLPNDLLTLFEEGTFKIPELVRLKKDVPTVTVGTAYKDEDNKITGKDTTFTIQDGVVSCQAFPFIVLTSNGEREFPAPFLRRCLRLIMKPPNEEELKRIITAHLDEEITLREDVIKLIKSFIQKRDTETLATDQLLNALFLIKEGRIPTDDELISLINKDLGAIEEDV